MQWAKHERETEMKQMTIAQKIGVGFAVVLVMLVVASSVGLRAMLSAATGFSDYREMARDTNLMGQIQASLLTARLQVKEFTISGSEQDAKDFDAAWKEMGEFLQQAEKDIIDPERAGKVKQTKTDADQYSAAFQEIVKIEKQQTDEGTKREAASANMMTLLDGLNNTTQPAEVEFARACTRQLLLGRLHMNKYLVNNRKEDCDLGLKELGKLKESLDGYAKVTQSEEKKKAIAGFAEQLALYNESSVKYIQMEESANKIANETLGGLGANMASATEDIKLSIKKRQDELGPQLQASNERSEWLVGVVSTVALCAGILLATIIIVSLNRVLRGIIGSLSSGSHEVGSASEQVSQSSQQLAEGATEQASSLEESSSALEELAGQARGNAEKAKRATEGADLSQATAEKANQAMSETVKTMNEIKESSGKISGIIKTIEEIAFQTNLLALNAAVEAARAGEHGKGFAVVAEEVRNLAQRSAVAAKDTAQLIETSVEQSKRGADVVGKASEAIEQILQAVRAVAKDTREVTVASNEQSEGISQINNAVGQMDKVTQQVAANAEESASASEELSAQAQQLQSIVGDLVKLVGGAGIQNGNGASSRKNKVHLQLAHAAGGHMAPAHKPMAQLTHDKNAPTATVAPGKKTKAAEAIPFDEDEKGFGEF